MGNKYNRIMIKLSGEALAGSGKTGIDEEFLDRLAAVIRTVAVDMGVEVAMVIGGGNFWRGAKNPGFDRTDADHIGMLATVMNCMAFADKLRQNGVPACAMSALQMDQVCEFYVKAKADALLREGKVVLLGCGTGRPYFTTDTGAVLRAAELKCDVVLLAKNIDAVYDADPAKDPNAKRYDRVSLEEVLDKQLKVMDLTATAFCIENKLPVQVFGVSKPENIIKCCLGENPGTEVYC